MIPDAVRFSNKINHHTIKVLILIAFEFQNGVWNWTVTGPACVRLSVILSEDRARSTDIELLRF